MRVMAMALLESARYVLTVVCLLIAVLANRWPMLVYVNGLLLLVMVYTLVVAIPLELNWSRSMYGGLLRRFFFMVAFTIGTYAIHYHHGGLVAGLETVTSWSDCVYFSATTWSTLGYGDIAPTGILKLATSLEAFTGLLTIAVLTAFIWLYCSERLQPSAADAPTSPLRVESDHVMGGFREVESDEVRRRRAERTKRLRLAPCRTCGTEPEMERFFDLVGRLAPFPNFVVVCGQCGAHSKYCKNGYVAAYLWNLGRVSPGRAR
jgi:hypothetical protein